MIDIAPHILAKQPGDGLFAITRPVSTSIAACELTHLDRSVIDVERARAEHRIYEDTLEALGCTLIRLSEAPDLPDSVFVDDTAVVLNELAIITHPGAASRRGELVAVAEALGRFRSLVWIQPPATLDGGDVFVVGRQIFAGRSTRTNDAGIEQLRSIVTPFRYVVHAVDVSGCLHLETAVSAIASDTLIIQPAWVKNAQLGGFRCVEVDPDEPFAANTIRLGDVLIRAAEYPRTNDRLAAQGFDIVTVPAAELARAEGGVTCCSILFEP